MDVLPSRPSSSSDRSAALFRLLGAGDDPARDRDQRLRTRAFAILSLLLLGVSVAFTVVGLVLGRPLGTIMSAVLFGAAVVGIVLSHRRHRRLDQSLRLLLVAGVAYLTAGHVLLGGLAASGGALAWGILAPVLALLLFDAAAGARWLAAYVAIALALIVADPLIVQVAPSSWTTAPPLLHAMSVLGPAVILMLLVRHVEGERLAAQRQYHGLLLRILPAPIVERLAAGDGTVAESHPAVSVVMADIAGFTAYADRAAPEDVLTLLTDVFSTFDVLCADAGLEKIKTVGDAYLAVAGAPTPRADHADAAVELALEMQRAAGRLPSMVANDLGLRVGVASGPVTAGVIGTDKPAYDVWGDTVNLASRMESTGVVGRVQVSASTAALLGSHAGLERRDAVEVKGKGRLTTYLVDPEMLSPDGRLAASRAARPNRQ